MTDKQGLAPTIVPFLAYEDVNAAIDFLTQAFGFVQHLRIDKDDGSVHARLALGDGLVYLANKPPPYESPRRHAQNCEAAARWLDTPYIVNGVHIQIDEIEAHFERAKSAGATILSGVEDGDQAVIYRAADPEGQRWMFSQPK